MAPLERAWACFAYVLSSLTLSPFSDLKQAPLPITTTPSQHGDQLSYPIFTPPGGRAKPGEGYGFECKYPALIGWSHCSTAENRTCWLRNDKTGEEYNIWTNYEDTDQTPSGIHRTYHIDVTDEWFNPDGMNFTEGKLFNNKYPGPWIEGCWGDVSPRPLVATKHIYSRIS